MDNTFIATLLIDLLQEYNRVSLPCLGSFIGQYKPSYFSKDGKTIYPPSKQIEFYQNEIWNDERLEKLIAEHENISLGKAKEKLAFWIDDVCVTLSTGATVSLPNFGEFVVSYGNRLKFIQYESKNLLAESFGLEPIETDAIVNPILPETSNIPVNDTDTITKKYSSSNDWHNTEPIRVKKSRTWIWVLLLSILLLIVICAGLVYLRFIKLPDSVTEKYPWINNYLKTENVDNRGLFPSSGSDENNNFDDNKYNNNTAIQDTSSALVIDGIDVDTQITDIDTLYQNTDSTTTAVTNNDSIVSSPAATYHIIVKSAKTYEDARKIAKEWAKKGYVVQILQVNDTSAEPYKLSIAYFGNENDANTQLNTYKQEGNEFNHAYIFQYSL